MTLLFAFILIMAIAGLAIREAEPARGRGANPPTRFSVTERIRGGETTGDETTGGGRDPVVIDVDPSPILETAVIETIDGRRRRLAFVRLAGGIALSGLVIGLTMVGAARILGIMLEHFAAGS